MIEKVYSTACAEKFPDKMKGFISIDSAPLQRKYVTAAELWLLKRMEPVYRYYPWKSLLKTGSKGVAQSEYGRTLMHEMMMTYDGNGEKDHAGSCIRYNKAWHKDTGIRLEWIKGAGHNSNTDEPEIINGLIEEVCHGKKQT